MKFIIWGTGKYFNRYRTFINLSDVVAFVDNNKGKWGTQLDNIPIISPDTLCEYTYDYILIMAAKYNEIRLQIKYMDINLENVIDIEHPGIFKNYVLQRKYDVIREYKGKGKIALFSHTLDRTGAPLVLFNMAKILVDMGYEVDLYSFGSDKMVIDFLQMGVPVTMFFNKNFDENYCYELISKYDMVIVNTIVLYKLIALLESANKPVIWWLHEEEDYMRKVIEEGMNVIPYEKLSIYGVSDRVQEAFNKYYQNIPCELLPYGIEYNFDEKKEKNNKIIFAIIGTVCKRKGQHILLEAIAENVSEWKDRAQFWIIGDIKQEEKHKFEECELVKVIGECNHSEVMKFYKDIDVVVCPSLNDPLPVVVAEGMQQRKVCIVSDMTGMSKYIRQYQNGLVCKANNSKDLCMCIQWVIDNIDKADEIGRKAYEIYKNNFSIESFRDRITSIVETCVSKRC